ncbi:MAG TPA: glycerol-3-phosphate dehydrogenase/oxidase, partial [Acidobacteriaceae bacterium]|nr:glycerol-3-phosphate dehydrogenase/oxidase [Acidobacteriaceae bacterium]
MTPERSALLRSLDGRFDVLIVGGGATGLGIAVDAATRGYATALVEAGDFAQATSSRATKLVHGGVRYLASGQFHLVYEALRERATMMRVAPHLVRPLPFVLPAFRRRELPYYGVGLVLYDWLSGKSTMGPTRVLGKAAVADRIPGIARAHLAGGVLYHDAQFNDARYALALARTAIDHGAAVLNYARCERLIQENGRVAGAVVRDVESGAEIPVRAKVVINAAGIFSDAMREMDAAGTPPLLSLSRGSHVVVDGGVLGGRTALIVPKTNDGRVIFAIPWEGRVVIGTTDVPATEGETEPGHTDEEIEYLLGHIAPYLEKRVQRSDVLAVFSGLRPLVHGTSAKTSQLSREHTIEMSRTGLITIAGGKWTTYRRMAQDTVDFAIRHKMLTAATCVTSETPLHGAVANPEDEYGSDAAEIRALVASDAGLGQRLDAALPY